MSFLCFCYVFLSIWAYLGLSGLIWAYLKLSEIIWAQRVHYLKLSEIIWWTIFDDSGPGIDCHFFSEGDLAQ